MGVCTNAAMGSSMEWACNQWGYAQTQQWAAPLRWPHPHGVGVCQSPSKVNLQEACWGLSISLESESSRSMNPDQTLHLASSSQTLAWWQQRGGRMCRRLGRLLRFELPAVCRMQHAC
eukprot:365893-Chlamydomonas_euryale.AAC.8